MGVDTAVKKIRSLEMVIEQMNLESGFESGRRIRMAEFDMSQTVPSAEMGQRKETIFHQCARARAWVCVCVCVCVCVFT